MVSVLQFGSHFVADVTTTKKCLAMYRAYHLCAFQAFYWDRKQGFILQLVSRNFGNTSRSSFYVISEFKAGWHIGITSLSVCLFECLFYNASVHSSVCVSTICPSIHPLSSHQHMHPPTHPPTHPSIHPLIHRSIHRSIDPSIHQSIHINTHPLIHPSI